MSAFSAAASDEDGDIISALREKLGRAHALCRIRSDRIRELEAMLRGASKVEQPQDHSEQYLGMVPPGWKLVPVDPTMPMLHRANGLTCIDFAALGEEGAFDLDELKEIYRAMLAAAPQPPVVEQPQPLTIEQIARIDSATEWPEGSLRNIGPRDWRRLLVAATRAIERAHGIGVEA